MILFDSDVLVYVHNEASQYHKRAYELEEEVLSGKLQAAISIQNLLEFYATVTNSSKMRKPLSSTEAKKVIGDYVDSPFKVLVPKAEDLMKTLELSTRENISGRKIFDVYLVATMLSSGIKTIYTANERDFEMFREIRAVNPFK